MATSLVETDITKIHRPRALVDAIEFLITKPQVWNELKAYYANGKKTGHKVMDLGEITDIVLNHDAKNGGHLATAKIGPPPGVPILKFQLGQKINTAVRRYYKLDKQYRINGYARQLQYSAPADAE